MSASAMQPLVVTAQMLIRRPAAEVFKAFVDPAITSRFWFTHSSGELVAGRRVTWEWRMYGAKGDVDVIELETDRRILIHWPTPVEWTFEARGNTATLVRIRCSGFEDAHADDRDDAIADALDSKGGFSFVLASCKALLEHGIELQLVADHMPDAHVG